MISSFSSFIVATSDLRCSLLELFVLWCKNRGSSKRDTGSYDIQFDDFSIESLSERDLGVILKQGLHLLRMDLYQRAVALHIEVQNGGGYRAGG